MDSGADGRRQHASLRITVPDMAAVDAIADLWVELADDQQQFGSHLHSEANRGAIQETLAGHVVTETVLVARDPDLLGFVTFKLETGRYRQDVTRGIVVNLFVRPQRRNEGVGSALLAAAERELAAAGADVVALDVLATNADAVRFYDRHGYRPHRIELEKRVESDRHTKEDG
jgi:ribosomal protein S18 acetylase RimI-like enzyme